MYADRQTDGQRQADRCIQTDRQTKANQTHNSNVKTDNDNNNSNDKNTRNVNNNNIALLQKQMHALTSDFKGDGGSCDVCGPVYVTAEQCPVVVSTL